jgi:hypothetical protein
MKETAIMYMKFYPENRTEIEKDFEESLKEIAIACDDTALSAA